MAKTTALPPVTGNRQIDEGFRELWKAVFGLGGTATGDIDSNNAPGYHDGTVGGHENIVQTDDIADSTTTAVSVTEPDADATYGAAEAALLNEIKSDFNNLVVEFRATITKHNQHLAAHRTQKLLK